ncbi:MAG: adenylosuccinate lyase, partial [Chloroflexi bacterium]|nr:adenylosuccinate lyase [Chloroflexota bacterium]
PLLRHRVMPHPSARPTAAMMLDYILSIFTHVMRGLRVDVDRMWQNLESSRGLIFSQRVLLALVEEKGLSREEAYDIVQRNAMRAWDDAHDFRQLLKADPVASEHLTSTEMDELFDYGYYTRYIDDNFERIGLLPAAVLA